MHKKEHDCILRAELRGEHCRQLHYGKGGCLLEILRACADNPQVAWPSFPPPHCSIIGRAGASPHSRSAGAPLYIFIYNYVIGRCHVLAKQAKQAWSDRRKRKAGTITSGYWEN